jgi:hypothetical protein
MDVEYESPEERISLLLNTPYSVPKTKQKGYVGFSTVSLHEVKKSLNIDTLNSLATADLDKLAISLSDSELSDLGKLVQKTLSVLPPYPEHTEASRMKFCDDIILKGILPKYPSLVVNPERDFANHYDKVQGRRFTSFSALFSLLVNYQFLLEKWYQCT